jgi:outer membrane immunogenic protein
MHKLFAAAIGVALLTQAEPAMAFDWDGFYAGVNLGYAASDADVHYDEDLDGVLDFSMAPAGWIGGVTVGANAIVGSGIVLGVEADLSLADITDTVPDVTDLAETVTSTTDWAASVRGRLGLDGGDFMPYLTAGLVLSHVQSSGTDGPGVEEDAVLGGAAIGAGVEFAVADNVTVKGEYLYSYFGEHTWFEGEAYQNTSTSSSSTVRGGVNFHF